MYLFIFQSIGTQELILIGMVALIFFGPRKLPEYARKIGKMMHEFRNTTNEFRETWEREVNFEEEANALKLDVKEDKDTGEINVQARGSNEILPPSKGVLPEVKQIEASEFDLLRKKALEEDTTAKLEITESIQTEEVTEETDKRSWI